MSPSFRLTLLPLFLELGFSTQLAPLTFGARYFFLMESGSVHCRMCSNDSGFYPLDRCSSTLFPTVATKMSPHIAKCPWEAKSSPLRTTAIEAFTSLKLVYFLPADSTRFLCTCVPTKHIVLFVECFHSVHVYIIYFFHSALFLRYSHNAWRSNSFTFTYCIVLYSLNMWQVNFLFPWFRLFLIFFPLKECKINILASISWCIGEWVSVEYFPSSGIPMLEGMHFFNFGEQFCNSN